MSKFVAFGIAKLPTMVGAAILSISIVGLGAAAFGLSLTLGGELLCAAAGMAVGSRYS